jgi:hypothetical protein
MPARHFESARAQLAREHGSVPVMSEGSQPLRLKRIVPGKSFPPLHFQRHLSRSCGRQSARCDLARQVYAVFLYSPHAHARIRGIDITAAASVPGVHAMLTGQDWSADGLGTLDPEFIPEDMGEIRKNVRQFDLARLLEGQEADQAQSALKTPEKSRPHTVRL